MIKRVLNRGSTLLPGLLGMLILIIVSLLIVSFAVPARAAPFGQETPAALLTAATPTDVYIVVAEVAVLEVEPVAAVARGPDYRSLMNSGRKFYYVKAISAQVRADYTHYGTTFYYLRI